MTDEITIDGVSIAFEPGQSILEAAHAAGVYIPHLCHNPELPVHGSCRVCHVRANGRDVAACTTGAQPGMTIENRTDAIDDSRRALLQMLFVEGNHICPACEKSGACQLQAVAYDCAMVAPELTHQYPQRTIDASHPDFVIDFNRCILCEQCVRASRELDGKDVFAISGRGGDAHLVVNSPTGKLGDSDLDAADRAAHICPVGAINPKQGAYAVPIGARRYDAEPIRVVGDAADAAGGN